MTDKNLKKWLTITLIVVLTLSTIAVVATYFLIEKSPDFYVGVSFCGDTAAEAKLLINRVMKYTNLFVLQSSSIIKNETATNEICDYAVNAGLSIIVFFGDLTPKYLEEKNLQWRLSWLNATRQRWGT